jgi:tetratricopeptide (TPR) repeat protein
MICFLLATVAAQAASPPQPFVAMVLRVEGHVELRPVKGDPRPAEAMDLLHSGDLLTTQTDGSAIVVFCSDGRRERVRPRCQATIGVPGCAPSTAVEPLPASAKEQETVREALKGLSAASRGAVAVLRDPPGNAGAAVHPFNGTRVLTNRPDFSWHPDKAARSYRLEVSEGSSGRLIWKETTTSASEKYPASSNPLRHGRAYVWRVIAIEESVDQPWAAGEFFVLSAIEAATLERLRPLTRSDDPADLSLAAAVFESKGVLDEAVRLYERLVSLEPEKKSFRTALARLYTRLGREEDAQKVRQEIEKLNAVHSSEKRAGLGALPVCRDTLSSVERPPIVKTNVISISPAGSPEEKVQKVDCSRLAGTYILGDHQGYNLRFVLKPEGKFDCSWRGCLGDYGTAIGDWRVDKNGLELSTSKSEGLLKHWPLSPLYIISLEDHYLLLREDDRKSFEELGPNRVDCFHKKEAEELLQRAEERFLEQRVKKAE